nr:uncharacterized protein LOC109401090 [Aedes albopictus]
MKFLVQLPVFSVLCFIHLRLTDAFYQCGIRQHGFLPLVHQGWVVEEGQWPWHAAVFHKIDGVGFQYKCGGTLVNERHVLTAAHCVVKRISRNLLLPAILHEIELHFGQHNLSKVTDNVVIRDVSKAHVHPEYGVHRNDIAVLVLRLPVEYFEYVIPICLDQKVDRDLRELEGLRGWIAGWGTTENETISEVLRTSSLPIVGHVQCLKDDRLLFGNILDENVFCAGYRNGTSPGPGDSGGGLYVSDGDRWVLRGIVSFGKLNEVKHNVDPYKYTVFVNVQQYLTWVKEVLAESEPQRDRTQKRISESECDRFRSLSKKRRNGDCINNRHPHNVMILQPDGKLLCNGVLVEENYVITTCNCVRPAQYRPVKVRIEAYGEVEVAEMFCHPKFIDKKTHYDLAILKLSRAVTLSSSLIPACLANDWTENLYDILLQSTFVHEGQDLIVLYESDENRITTTEKCNSMFEYWMVEETNNDSAICVINTDPLRRASYGTRASTGDALQSSNRRSCMFTVVGVKARSSDKYFTRNSDLPMVDAYARISYHLDWIEDSIWNVQPKETECGVDYKWDKLWHVAIFHRNITSNGFTFTCSGTLISAKHVVTTAGCVLNQTSGQPLPEDTFELKVGLERLSQPTSYAQTRYVSEVHVHPKSAAFHGIGILVTSWPFRITQDVKPICLGLSKNSAIWNSDGEISGWETFETGVPNDIRRSDRISILASKKCSEIAGKQLPTNMFCSDYPKDKRTHQADRGSGLYYHNVGDKSYWTLVGIASSEMKGNGTERYTLFVNVQQYVAWIDEVVSQSEPNPKKTSKRISEKECERFRMLSRNEKGVCENAGNFTTKKYPHIVSLLDDKLDVACSGVLVKENRVLTACRCVRDHFQPTQVEIDSGDRVKISEIICHPDYNSATDSNHDLAVLKLRISVELSSQLVPACLANDETENLDDAILLSMMYRNSKENKNVTTLYSTYEYIGTEEQCNRVTATGNTEAYSLPHSQFCTISPGSYSDPSIEFNDAVIQSVDHRICRFTVLGIASKAVNNNADTTRRPELATIVNHVAYYLDWIEKVVWG